MPLTVPRVGRKLPPVTLDSFGEKELADLDEQAAHVLRLRSGMLDGERHTLREVGEELGVGPERVRQLQAHGLRTIRQLREAQRHLRLEPAHVPYRWRLPKRVRDKRERELHR